MGAHQSKFCYSGEAINMNGWTLSHDDVANEATNRSGRRSSHAITQSLGGSSFPIAVETHINVDAPLKPDEALLLCSDGLTDLVSDDANLSIVVARRERA